MVNFYLFLATHSIVCSNPEELIGDSVTVSGYTPTAVEGTTITYHCPPGAVLDGINSSTCMENGEWEPAPIEIHCLGINFGTQFNLTTSWYIKNITIIILRR